MLAEVTEPAGLLGGVAETSWQQIPPFLTLEKLRCSLAPGNKTEKAHLGAGWELCESAEKLPALGDSPCQVGDRADKWDVGSAPAPARPRGPV